MKFLLISSRNAGVAVLAVSAAALWGMSPHAAAAPPQMSIFQKRPPTATAQKQKTPRFLFGSAPRSQYTAARTSAPSSTYTRVYSSSPQLAVASSQPVIVRPPVYASNASTIDSANRSRLELPVQPQGAPAVLAATSTASIAPAPTSPGISPAKTPAIQVMKATPVWPPEPEQPDYARPVFGRPGFVHPPGLFGDPTAVIDVREYVPGQKVRDPHTGMVFLVPPV